MRDIPGQAQMVERARGREQAAKIRQGGQVARTSSGERQARKIVCERSGRARKAAPDEQIAGTRSVERPVRKASPGEQTGEIRQGRKGSPICTVCRDEVVRVAVGKKSEPGRADERDPARRECPAREAGEKGQVGRLERPGQVFRLGILRSGKTSELCHLAKCPSNQVDTCYSPRHPGAHRSAPAQESTPCRFPRLT